MYNPYDLVPLLINGKQIYGRPIELDSVIVNHTKITNGFGSLVKPSKLSTTCPDCGQGLMLDVKLSEPPFFYSTDCYICRPTKPENTIFVNPLIDSIGHDELDPLMNVKIEPNITTTVAERNEEKQRLKKKKKKANSKHESKKNDVIRPHADNQNLDTAEDHDTIRLHADNQSLDTAEECDLENLLSESNQSDFDDGDLVDP